MTKHAMARAVPAALLVIVMLAAFDCARRQQVPPPAATSPAMTPASPPATPAAEMTHLGALHGRVTTRDGAIHEGRLRWGGGEEAFWGDTFNGFKDENPWTVHVPPERLPRKRRSLEVFGMTVIPWESPAELGRPFLARFGDIARIDALGLDVRVTLKSGTAFDLDLLSASDFDDGVRVWDRSRGVVDLESVQIRTIELLPGAASGPAPDRLHGTVRTPQGDFTGFLQWDRDKGVGSDEIRGHAAQGLAALRLDSIRSIARRSPDGCVVTLLDGRDVALSGGSDVGRDNRGTYVDDRRYGRVLVSWDAFERVDFSPGGDGPAYEDFPPGRPLTGSVAVRDGRRLVGRIVYDLDESETTETLDAPSQGVDYTIPFGLIASIVPPGRDERSPGSARVVLHDGEALQLERAGDLGDGNAGLLVFVEGRQGPEHVAWADVEAIELDRPPAMYPPLGEPGPGRAEDGALRALPDPPGGSP